MLLKDWDLFFFVELKVTAYDAKSKVTAYIAMCAEIYMMEGRSFWPIVQWVKQGRQWNKDSVNDSNVNDRLRNVTEGVLPSLPPVESQDTAYEPKSKVTNRYTTTRAPGRARNNIKEGGSILEVPMDDEDDYFSEEGCYCEKRIESYVNERILPYPTLALPPVQIKGFQHLYKSTKTMSSGQVHEKRCHQ